MRFAALMLAGSFLAGSAAPALADAGMWLPDQFPSDKVAKAYGFTPTADWLERLRLSSARLARGCSGSFVSAHGLVLTNHHCVRGCLEEIQTPELDTVNNGYRASDLGSEKACPTMEVNQLVKIEDVTAQVNAATKGKDGQAFADALKAVEADLTRACSATSTTRCDIVRLFEGARYDLYTYHRYQDVRLVFAPEDQMAFFGGDPDNFNFPRYDFDMSMVRVYENGAPAELKNYLPFSTTGTKEGELVFTAGHPGGSDRQLTAPWLELARDYTLMSTIAYSSEFRGLLTQYLAGNAEHRRQAAETLFGIENGLKVQKGRYLALAESRLLADKKAEEAALAKRSPEVKAALEQQVKAAQALRRIYARYVTLEGGSGKAGALVSPRGFSGELFLYARGLLRAAAEKPKPDAARLTEYTDASMPAIQQSLLASKPVFPELEKVRLAWSLTKMREALTPDDPLVGQIFGGDTAEQAAAKLVDGTRLADPAVRKALLDGGQGAIDAAADDPMIRLAKLVDPASREVRRTYEAEVDAPRQKYGAVIAKAMQNPADKPAPDATFTLRFSYGKVDGWMEQGQKVPPYTMVSGLYQRATGAAPFQLTQNWVDAKDKLNPATPFNLSSTNDIIGGNSGSPLVDKDLKLVGLIFDGNIHSIGGDYGYDPTDNRAVSVDVRLLREGLEKVYGLGWVLKEIDGGPLGG